MRAVRPHLPIHFFILGAVFLYAGFLIVAPIVAIVQKTFSEGVAPIVATFQDPNVMHALQLTYFLSFGAVIVNTLLGMATAWVLVRQRFLGRRLLNTLVDIPFVFSPVIFGYVMIILFGREGWLTPTLFPIVFALPGILIGKAFVSVPFIIREVQPILASLEREPEEAALVMGASHWTVFRRIVFPNIWDGVLYGIVLTFARAVGEFGAVSVVSGGIEGRTETATMFVFRALNDRNDIGAYSMSLLLGISAVVILVVMNLLRRRIGK
jgi:sulfate/thiosulfate transport system permease protein